jgi:hypothetical protein
MSGPHKNGVENVATPEQLADETRRVRKVRQLVDISTSLIMQSRMSRAEAELLVESVRDRILTLFPDGATTYEVVYAPRFTRLIDEFTRSPAERRGVVLPFPTKLE